MILVEPSQKKRYWLISYCWGSIPIFLRKNKYISIVGQRLKRRQRLLFWHAETATWIGWRGDSSGRRCLLCCPVSLGTREKQQRRLAYGGRTAGAPPAVSTCRRWKPPPLFANPFPLHLWPHSLSVQNTVRAAANDRCQSTLRSWVPSWIRLLCQKILPRPGAHQESLSWFQKD
jgi:hypothetical protein